MTSSGKTSGSVAVDDVVVAASLAAAVDCSGDCADGISSVSAASAKSGAAMNSVGGALTASD